MNQRVRGLTAIASAIVALFTAAQAFAQEIVLPQSRHAFYSSEPIELAVAGLASGTTAHVTLTPKSAANTTVTFTVTGDGSTPAVRIPAGSLAPDTYVIALDGVAGPNITVSNGVWDSSLLLSESGVGPDTARANTADFVLGNFFDGTLLDSNNQPVLDPQGMTSQGAAPLEASIANNVPDILYMYWTGFVLHKPWGVNKSWAAPDEMLMMRLFNYHVAQQVRRYDKTIISAGTMDEPGLAWGQTAIGTSQSGFPNWDEEGYYRDHGYDFNYDPGSGSVDDWTKYMTVRTGIMRGNWEMARHDWKAVSPDVPFATDCYAPGAIMDGTDAYSQEVNDYPTSHIFDDFAYGKLGIPGDIWQNKAGDPTRKLAHAMNGQLVGGPVSHDEQVANYHLMLNGLLMGGIRSNWWLNSQMGQDDYVGLNGPALRYGGLFANMQSTGSDVAQLWSYTESMMRQKDLTAKMAHLPDGQTISATITALPGTTAGPKQGPVTLNAYAVGDNCWLESVAANEALLRAGYPAQVIEDKSLPSGVLKNYKVLVIVHQTFPFTTDVAAAIAAFQKAGGQVVVDPGTTIDIPGAIRTTANCDDHGLLVTLATPGAGASAHDTSYVQTNYFTDEQSRNATVAFRQTMQTTVATPVIKTDSIHLGAVRQQAGQGMLYMVENGYDKLPDIGPADSYPIYNYAPYSATFSLGGIPRGSAVYAIEGMHWDKVSRLADPQAPINASFDAGEMKMYLVAPHAPRGLNLEAAFGPNLHVHATLDDLKMPWPLKVVVTGPTGSVLYTVYRGTDAAGEYDETFPIGGNASSGAYTVAVTSEVGPLSATLTMKHSPTPVVPAPMTESVRIFDQSQIAAFLAAKTPITIAIGSEDQRAEAQTLAAGLAAKGVTATVALESTVMHKRLYPAVWDPYLSTYQVGGDEVKPSGDVKRNVTINRGDGGQDIATAADGSAVANWRVAGTLATVGQNGWADLASGGDTFYYPGVKFYIDANLTLNPLNAKSVPVKSTPEERAKWARPWDDSLLSNYSGTCSLVPQLPEAWIVDQPLILLGDSTQSKLVRALQASQLLLETVDSKYPGPGKSLISFAWSPFALEKNVVLVGASDKAGLDAGIAKLVSLAKP